MPFGLHGTPAMFQRTWCSICGWCSGLQPDMGRGPEPCGFGVVVIPGSGYNCKPSQVYLSQKLFPREKNYSVIEKEALAIKWEVEALWYYLLGRTFTLIMEHAPLCWLHTMKDMNSQIMRWYLDLQPFSFQIHQDQKGPPQCRICFTGEGSGIQGEQYLGRSVKGMGMWWSKPVSSWQGRS